MNVPGLLAPAVLGLCPRCSPNSRSATVLPLGAGWDCKSCPQEEEVWRSQGPRDRRSPRLLTSRPAGMGALMHSGIRLCVQQVPPSIQGQETLKGVTDSGGSPDSGLWAGGAPSGAEGRPCSPVSTCLETQCCVHPGPQSSFRSGAGQRPGVRPRVPRVHLLPSTLLQCPSLCS